MPVETLIREDRDKTKQKYRCLVHRYFCSNLNEVTMKMKKLDFNKSIEKYASLSNAFYTTIITVMSNIFNKFAGMLTSN